MSFPSHTFDTQYLNVSPINNKDPPNNSILTSSLSLVADIPLPTNSKTFLNIDDVVPVENSPKDTIVISSKESELLLRIKELEHQNKLYQQIINSQQQLTGTEIFYLNTELDNYRHNEQLIRNEINEWKDKYTELSITTNQQQERYTNEIQTLQHIIFTKDTDILRYSNNEIKFETEIQNMLEALQITLNTKIDNSINDNKYTLLEEQYNQQTNYYQQIIQAKDIQLQNYNQEIIQLKNTMDYMQSTVQQQQEQEKNNIAMKQQFIIDKDKEYHTKLQKYEDDINQWKYQYIQQESIYQQKISELHNTITKQNNNIHNLELTITQLQTVLTNKDQQLDKIYNNLSLTNTTIIPKNRIPILSFNNSTEGNSTINPVILSSLSSISPVRSPYILPSVSPYHQEHTSNVKINVPLSISQNLKQPYIFK